MLNNSILLQSCAIHLQTLTCTAGIEPRQSPTTPSTCTILRSASNIPCMPTGAGSRLFVHVPVSASITSKAGFFRPLRVKDTRCGIVWKWDRHKHCKAYRVARCGNLAQSHQPAICLHAYLCAGCGACTYPFLWSTCLCLRHCKCVALVVLEGKQ